MSRIFRTTNVPVKATRKTARPSTSFGAGILPYRPFAGVMPFTVQDAAEAVLMFADSSEPDWDALATEAEHQDRMDAMAPSTYGVCLVCNEPCDYLEDDGMCVRCSIHACETSTPNRY